MLDAMWQKYNLLEKFNHDMLMKGYAKNELTYTNAQINMISEMIQYPTEILLSELLRKQTNYRLKTLLQGKQNLLRIIEYPEGYTLNSIDDYKEAWRSKKTLIFDALNRQTYVFSPIEEINSGQIHIKGKWQKI